MGARHPRHVPEQLDDHIFSDTLTTYALLDGAKLPHIQQLLATEGLPHRCLFTGRTKDDMGDVAPWLVALTPTAPLTRRLFTAGPSPHDLWRARPGILFQSAQGLDALRKHFRRFVRLQDAGASWFYFRFWEPFILYGLAERATPIATHICAPLTSLFTPLDIHSGGHILNPDPSADRPPQPDLTAQAKSVLSQIRQYQVMVEIAETLYVAGAEPTAATALDWQHYRAQTVDWGNAAHEQYGLTQRKSLHSYLMLRHAMPEAFDTHAAPLTEILLAETPEAAKLDTMISFLRTV